MKRGKTFWKIDDIIKIDEFINLLHEKDDFSYIHKLIVHEGNYLYMEELK